MSRVACLMLAAGQSSRFGSCKQLVKVNAKPMIMLPLEQLKPIFKQDLFTLLGAHADTLRPLVEPLCEVIQHPEWASGLGSSIAKGVAVITRQSDYDGIMITLADQVALRSKDFFHLLGHFNGKRIVAAEYGQTLGVPAIFPQCYFKHLCKLEGDYGAKKLIRENLHQVQPVPLDRAGIDIDTRHDLENYQIEALADPRL